MQISNQFPQFSEKKTLIIVASTQAADIYQASNGEIEKVTEVRVEPEEDNEQPGRFDRSSKGQQLGVGGVAEKGRRRKAKQRFHNDFRSALDNLTVSFEQIILLSSPQDKPATREHIEDLLTAEIVLEIDGNFVGEHPDTILEQIKQAQEEEK